MNHTNDKNFGDEVLSCNLGVAPFQTPSSELLEGCDPQSELWRSLLDIWDFNGPVLIY
jgi:hypothetical protein